MHTICIADECSKFMKLYWTRISLLKLQWANTFLINGSFVALAASIQWSWDDKGTGVVVVCKYLATLERSWEEVSRKYFVHSTHWAPIIPAEQEVVARNTKYVP